MTVENGCRDVHRHPETLLNPIYRTHCILNKDLTWEKLAVVSDLLEKIYPYMLVHGEAEKGTRGGTSNGMLVNYTNPLGKEVIRALFPAHTWNNWESIPQLLKEAVVGRPGYSNIFVSKVTAHNESKDITVGEVVTPFDSQFALECPRFYTGEIREGRELYILSNRWDGNAFAPVVISTHACQIPSDGLNRPHMDMEKIQYYGAMKNPKKEDFLTCPGGNEVPGVSFGYSGSVVVTRQKAQRDGKEVEEWQVVGLLHGAPMKHDDDRPEPLIFTRAHKVMEDFDPSGVRMETR